MTKLAVHPVANLFPMLADDELGELAEDIKQRGLLHPIVLDGEGRILDGRNRHAACLLAKVEPTFVTYDGADPAGYALAVNIVRRNLTTGARQIIAARAARLNGQSERQAAAATNLLHQRIHDANVVLDWASELADDVIYRGLPISQALSTARDRKRAADSADAQLAKLREAAPDLAAQVADESLTLAEAIAANRAREAARESERRAATASLTSVLTYLTSRVLTPDALAADYADVLTDFDADALDFAASTMTTIAELKRAERE